jgi:hypothetical protein
VFLPSRDHIAQIATGVQHLRICLMVGSAAKGLPYSLTAVAMSLYL